MSGLTPRSIGRTGGSNGTVGVRLSSRRSRRGDIGFVSQERHPRSLSAEQARAPAEKLASIRSTRVLCDGFGASLGKSGSFRRIHVLLPGPQGRTDGLPQNWLRFANFPMGLNP